MNRKIFEWERYGGIFKKLPITFLSKVDLINTQYTKYRECYQCCDHCGMLCGGLVCDISFTFSITSSNPGLLTSAIPFLG